MERISTQFRTEGQPAFPVVDTENDNSADSSSSEETTTEETAADEAVENSDETTQDPSGEEGKGFADHPRWKEREEDHKKRFNEQETRHVEEIAKLREEFEAKIAGKGGEEKKQGEAVAKPSWFGGSDEQWGEFQEWNKGLIKQAQDGAISEISSKAKQEQDRVADATKYFNDEVTAIEGDKEVNPEGLKVDRNKLLLTAQKFDLVDSKGRWNYRAAWQFLRNASNKSKSDTIEEKKKVGGATVTGKNQAEEKPKKVMTSEDFKKPGARPW